MCICNEVAKQYLLREAGFYLLTILSFEYVPPQSYIFLLILCQAPLQNLPKTKQC